MSEIGQMQCPHQAACDILAPCSYMEMARQGKHRRTWREQNRNSVGKKALVSRVEKKRICRQDLRQWAEEQMWNPTGLLTQGASSSASLVRAAQRTVQRIESWRDWLAEKWRPGLARMWRGQFPAPT